MEHAALESFQDILRRERVLRGWSQADVAEQIGSNSKTVGRWERGLTFPSPYLCQQLSKLYGKTPQELGLVRGESRSPAENHARNEAAVAERAIRAVKSVFPEVKEEAREASEQEADLFARFLTACCELHPRAWCRASEIWQAYERWVAEQHERFPLSRRAFIAQLQAHGCRADRTKSARIWRGITIVKKD